MFSSGLAMVAEAIERTRERNEALYKENLKLREELKRLRRAYGGPEHFDEMNIRCEVIYFGGEGRQNAYRITRHALEFAKDRMELVRSVIIQVATELAADVMYRR